MPTDFQSLLNTLADGDESDDPGTEDTHDVSVASLQALQQGLEVLASDPWVTSTSGRDAPTSCIPHRRICTAALAHLAPSTLPAASGVLEAWVALYADPERSTYDGEGTVMLVQALRQILNAGCLPEVVQAALRLSTFVALVTCQAASVADSAWQPRVASSLAEAALHLLQASLKQQHADRHQNTRHKTILQGATSLVWLLAACEPVQQDSILDGRMGDVPQIHDAASATVHVPMHAQEQGGQRTGVTALLQAEKGRLLQTLLEACIAIDHSQDVLAAATTHAAPANRHLPNASWCSTAAWSVRGVPWVADARAACCSCSALLLDAARLVALHAPGQVLQELSANTSTAASSSGGSGTPSAKDSGQKPRGAAERPRLFGTAAVASPAAKALLACMRSLLAACPACVLLRLDSAGQVCGFSAHGLALQDPCQPPAQHTHADSYPHHGLGSRPLHGLDTLHVPTVPTVPALLAALQFTEAVTMTAGSSQHTASAHRCLVASNSSNTRGICTTRTRNNASAVLLRAAACHLWHAGLQEVLLQAACCLPRGDTSGGRGGGASWSAVQCVERCLGGMAAYCPMAREELLLLISSQSIGPANRSEATANSTQASFLADSAGPGNDSNDMPAYGPLSLTASTALMALVHACSTTSSQSVKAAVRACASVNAALSRAAQCMQQLGAEDLVHGVMRSKDSMLSLAALYCARYACCVQGCIPSAAAGDDSKPTVNHGSAAVVVAAAVTPAAEHVERCSSTTASSRSRTGLASKAGNGATVQPVPAPSSTTWHEAVEMLAVQSWGGCMPAWVDSTLPPTRAVLNLAAENDCPYRGWGGGSSQGARVAPTIDANTGTGMGSVGMPHPHHALARTCAELLLQAAERARALQPPGRYCPGPTGLFTPTLGKRSGSFMGHAADASGASSSSSTGMLSMALLLHGGLYGGTIDMGFLHALGSMHLEQLLHAAQVISEGRRGPGMGGLTQQQPHNKGTSNIPPASSPGQTLCSKAIYSTTVDSTASLGAAVQPVPQEPNREGSCGDQSFDEDGLRVVWSSGPRPAQAAARRAWRSGSLGEHLRWGQTSGDVSVSLVLPAGTRKAEVCVLIERSRLCISLTWAGRVLDGPLVHAVKPGESIWWLEEEGAQGTAGAKERVTIQVLLVKSNPTYWRGLFQGGEERSFQQLLQEAVQAEEHPLPGGTLDADAHTLLAELRDRQAAVVDGSFSLENSFDDFRLVLGENLL